MSKKEYKVTENGNQVTIEIHTAGTVSMNKDLIDSLINKWKQGNLNKKIIGDPQIISGASGHHKRAVVDSMRFSWELVPEKITLTTPVSKFCCPITGGKFCTIESEENSRKLNILLALKEIAKTDFPSLQDDDIDVFNIAKSPVSISMGIEFFIASNTQIPSDYKQIF